MILWHFHHFEPIACRFLSPWRSPKRMDDEPQSLQKETWLRGTLHALMDLGMRMISSIRSRRLSRDSRYSEREIRSMTTPSTLARILLFFEGYWRNRSHLGLKCHGWNRMMAPWIHYTTLRATGPHDALRDFRCPPLSCLLSYAYEVNISLVLRPPIGDYSLFRVAREAIHHAFR